MAIVSVCIPAHNECSTIRTTLESILHQTFPNNPNDMQITVCANACSDNTEEVVSDIASKYPIELIHTKQKGKANAWNLLRENAKSDTVFFADADVVIRRDAFWNLYTTLYSDHKTTVVGAVGIPYYPKDLNQLSKKLYNLINITPDNQDFILGRLYLVDNNRLQRKMEEKNLTRMPKEVIADDIWIQIMSGNDWKLEKEARVYYRPCSIKESVNVYKRIIKGLKQLKDLYPDLYNSKLSDKFKRKMRMIAEADSYGKKIELFLGYVARKSIGYLASKRLKNESNAMSRWEVSSSSKNPIPLSIIYK